MFEDTFIQSFIEIQRVIMEAHEDSYLLQPSTRKKRKFF